jgi:hypothetical protein
MSDNAPLVPDPMEGDAAAMDAPAAMVESAETSDPPIPVPDDGLGEWPTHGGPLGCLMSVVIGCVLAGFLGSTLISFVHFTKAGFGGWYIFAAVVVMVGFTILFGWLGWQIGKRVYREYPPSPRAQRIAERLAHRERTASSP